MAERLLRLVLLFYSSHFRARFAEEFIQTFRDGCGQAASTGFGAWSSMMLRELAGAVRGAVSEWRLQRLHRRRAALAVGSKKSPQWRSGMFESLLQDLRIAFRTLTRTPLFSAVVVVTISLGIGANTAIFSVLNGVLLEPMPYPDSERIVTIWEDFSAKGGPELEFMEVPNFFEWKSREDLLDSLAAYSFGSANLVMQGEPEQLAAASVSRDFFAVFGTEPILGRTFSPEEDRPGGEKVVALSYELWQRSFGGSSSALGQAVSIDGRPHTIVGVLPQGFQTPFASGVSLWMPVAISPTTGHRGNFYLQAVGRLHEGVPAERASARLNALMQRMGETIPDVRDVSVQVIPLLDLIVQPIRTGVWVLIAVVGLVLLIVCANIANMMLARATPRRREFAVRTAMGAPRTRVFRQLVTESLVLALVGGALGLLLGYAGLRLLVAAAPANVPRLDEVVLNGRVLLYTLGVTIASGLIFGCAPAVQSMFSDVNAGLKEGGRGADQALRGRWLRSLLVVGETAFALVLLIVSGLLVQSFVNLNRVDPGFRKERVLTATINLPQSYSSRDQFRTFYRSLLEAVVSRPEVEAAAGVSVLPLSGSDNDAGVQLEGRPVPVREGEFPAVWYRIVTPDYFKAMGIRLIEGRAFQESDRDGSQAVAIVSDVVARRFWPGESAVGKRLGVGGGRDPVWMTIIGVAVGVRHNGLAQEPRLEMYLPFEQFPRRFMNLVLHCKVDEESLAALLRDEVKRLDPGLPISSVTSMRQLVDASVAQPRFFMDLTTAFAALALILASIGIYGVVSYGVAQRSPEVGLRIALGAERRHVLGLVLRQGLILAGIGTAAGWALAYFATRYLSTQLFEVAPTDVATYLGLSLALVGVSAIACVVPAFRATRIDPLQALRCE